MQLCSPRRSTKPQLMRFILPRAELPPTIVDRLGRNLVSSGFDLIQVSYTQSAGGEFIELLLGGAGMNPSGEEIPFRFMQGTSPDMTRLYDHHGQDLVNALRIQGIGLAHHDGRMAFRVTIPLRPDDLVDIPRGPRVVYSPGF